MAEFYVATTATEGTHMVYNASSTQLPAQDTLRYIGSYASSEAAVSIAGEYYPKVDYFTECTPAQG